MPTLVPAGPDYATDILADPWDFLNELDLSPFPDEFIGWTITSNLARTVGRTAFLKDGHFVGRTVRGGGNLIPLLYRGGANFVTSSHEHSGVFDHKAIPTAGYGKLAVAMTMSASTALNSQLAAYWFADPYNAATVRDGGVAFRIPQSGAHIYIVDLVTGLWTDSRGNTGGPVFFPVSGASVAAWNSMPRMRGFSLRATSDPNAEVDIAIDWVRITQRDGAPGAAMLPLTFTNCTGDYSVEVEAAPGESWDVIHTGSASGTTTAQVNYGVLHPGVWPLRVTCYPSGRNSAGFSSTPVNLTINAPPLTTVINPDAIGGADFATHVMGNPWDMNDVRDVRQYYGVSAPSIVSNTFQATSDAGGDPALVFVYGTPQVDTSRYRNLTFSLELDTPFGLAAPDGSVARVFWARPLPGNQHAATTTRDIIVWPGRNTYTMDLSQLTVTNGGLEAGGQLWNAGPVPYFRIDPHESLRGVTFRMGPVLLTAPDEVAVDGRFDVQYSFTDLDAGLSSYEARIYLDTDRDPTAFFRTLASISSGIVPNAPLTYSFVPSHHDVPPGEYFFYIQIVDHRGGATHARGAYASGPLRVGTSGPIPPGAPSLVAVQTVDNPVTLAWSPGAGDPPTNFTIVAGTSPGAANLVTVPLGLQTGITANAPPGLRIYARVVASNAAGSAVSNEISFVVGVPGPPVLQPPSLNGRTVTLGWSPGAGASPSYYLVLARLPGSPNVIASFRTSARSVVVPNVPPGTYIVTIAAVGPGGPGPESNPITVVVP